MDTVADRELAAVLAASASIHETDGSDSPKSWMEDARRMQEQEEVSDWKTPWNDNDVTEQQHGESHPAAEPGLNDFGRHEIIEQYRIMAEHEAHLRLKNTTGFDLEEFEKTAPLVGKIDNGYRKALLTPMLPEPRRVIVTSTMPPLKEPELPTLSRKHVQKDYKKEIAPIIYPGTIVSSGEEVPPGEKSLQCLGCKKSLRVQQKALYASCPNCSAESPAITMHQPVSV